MNILMLNWRDPYNPHAGGAELITQRYAEFWAKKHKVYWLSNSYQQSKSKEIINNIYYERISPILSSNLIKQLFFYPIYLVKSIWRAKQIIKSQNIDIVIDEIHGFPFFTPIFSSKKNILLVCEVADKIWDKMYPFPINIIGKYFEKTLYLFYKNTEIWAISESTKKDILNINNKLNVKVLPLGINIEEDRIENYTKLKKFNTPTGVFLARLVKMKGIEIALEAAVKIKEKLPEFRLYVIGKGEKEYTDYLERKVYLLGLEDTIIFKGFIDENSKFELLRKSHFLFHTSYKEGFGLTVLESASVGTPSIVMGGSSMDELINNEKDGFIIKNAEELAKCFIENINSKKYKELSRNSYAKSRKYLWKTILEDSIKITNIP